MKTIIFSLAAGFLLILGTVAITRAHQDSVNPEVIHGCFKKGNGALFILGSTEGCSGGATAIDWNAQGPQGIPGSPGAQGEQGPPGLVHMATFSNSQGCATITGEPPTRRQQFSQDFKLILEKAAKVYLTGHITGSTSYNGAGLVKIRTLINGGPAMPDNMCYRANGQVDIVSFPISVVVDLPAGTHTIDFESLTWHKDANGWFRLDTVVVHAFILEIQ